MIVILNGSKFSSKKVLKFLAIALSLIRTYTEFAFLRKPDSKEFMHNKILKQDVKKAKPLKDVKLFLSFLKKKLKFIQSLSIMILKKSYLIMF